MSPIPNSELFRERSVPGLSLRRRQASRCTKGADLALGELALPPSKSRRTTDLFAGTMAGNDLGKRLLFDPEGDADLPQGL
jgi:hypothetical protein